MMLLTKDLTRKLIDNGTNAYHAIMDDGATADCQPVVKFFAPWNACTWIITELEMDQADNGELEPTGRLFGLCDLGMGYPELGYVTLTELTAVQGPLGLKIERDRHWHANASLSAYADAAREAGHIVDRIAA